MRPSPFLHTIRIDVTSTGALVTIYGIPSHVRNARSHRASQRHKRCAGRCHAQRCVAGPCDAMSCPSSRGPGPARGQPEVTRRGLHASRRGCQRQRGCWRQRQSTWLGFRGGASDQKVEVDGKDLTRRVSPYGRKGKPESGPCFTPTLRACFIDRPFFLRLLPGVDRLFSPKTRSSAVTVTSGSAGPRPLHIGTLTEKFQAAWIFTIGSKFTIQVDRFFHAPPAFRTISWVV